LKKAIETTMMTTTNISPTVVRVEETCGFSGCSRPRRPRAGETGGKSPVYCDLIDPATGKLTHTPYTSARERRRQQQGVTERPGEVVGETPTSAAHRRAAGLLEQFQAAGKQLSDTLAAAIEAMTAAGDPEKVRAELAAAERRFQSAEVARDQARAEAAQAQQAADDAGRARDEAITEVETLEAALASTRAELEQAHAEHAVEMKRLRAETAEKATGRALLHAADRARALAKRRRITEIAGAAVKSSAGDGVL
jgi:hypothetical protein